MSNFTFKLKIGNIIKTICPVGTWEGTYFTEEFKKKIFWIRYIDKGSESTIDSSISIAAAISVYARMEMTNLLYQMKILYPVLTQMV